MKSLMRANNKWIGKKGRRDLRSLLFLRQEKKGLLVRGMLLGGKLVSWRPFAVIFVAAGFFLVFIYFLHEFPGAFHVQVQLLWHIVWRRCNRILI